MNGMDGLEVLRRVQESHPETVVVMISGHGTVETAVKATKLGAFDFLEKPLSIEKTLVVVKNALEHQALLEENRLLREQLQERYQIIGESVEILRRRPAVRYSVLFYGLITIGGIAPIFFFQPFLLFYRPKLCLKQF